MHMVREQRRHDRRRGRHSNSWLAGVLFAGTLSVGAGVVTQPAGSVSAAVTGVQFNTDVTVAGREETVWVTADAAGTVNLSIDFNRNGTLEPSEQVVTNQAVTAGVNRIVYTAPTGGAFVPGPGALTRITATPGGTTDTTRELYDAEGAALAECPAGTVPIPVSVIQNPSFETRTQDFQNTSAASTISYAANWYDSHPTGGQYHYFDPPTFDSGPVASTQPVRAGADGQAFEGGHSSGGTGGEGAVNTLLVPLNPASTYVGFFSMAAGGYSREGSGSMVFFGTSNRESGSIPGAGVTPQTPANTELLFQTPVVNYAGNGVRPTWELNTFSLDPAQAWPYLRVEVRNANPAGDGTVAGQVWMNFDDFHMYECTPRLLQITKTSTATADTRPGDTVTYTVSATNIGSVDYTAADPAVLLDDLTGVLDDGTYNADADADIGADPTFANSRLTWTGALAAGQTVTVTYTVTLSGSGDGVVRNVAFQSRCVPGSIGCPPPPPPQQCLNNIDPATGLLCDEVIFELPRLQIVKSADATTLPANGATLTYTVTVTNIGPGDYTAAAPATMTDDLTDVIDDTTDPTGLTATVGSTPTFTSPFVSWSGVLTAGQSSVISYAVTYDGAGDQLLENLACVPEDEAQDPELSCITVTIPGSGLVQEKVADPLSGTSVEAGDTVTYTLAFTNTGNAPAAVNTSDDLSDVLDDATLLGVPTADPGLTAVPSGDDILITGTVPVNTVLYVRYTVTVEPFADQGNHVLANALQCQPGDPEPCEPQVTEHPIRHLTLTKAADPTTDVNAGDVVTYTLTVTNDGAGEYTALDPASVTDDLTGVLDDATYNGGTATAGTLTETLPILTWTGPLAPTGVVTITYGVTVTSVGDHSLENTAIVPGCIDDPACAPPPVIVLLPHIVPTKSANPASGQPLLAGTVVTYTLTFTSDGQAAGPVDSTDDLSNIIDDADVTSEPVSSNPAVTPERNGGAIRITGSLAAGASVTITYQVTIRPDGQRGNNIAGNVLTMDVPPIVCDPVCGPVPPPTTEHPIGELDDWKTVDPASGSSVQAGQTVTYTLHFANTGEAPVAVNRQDVVSGALDDATLVSGPTVSDAALSVSALTDGRFTITGSLGVDQEVTVTYAVTVNPDGARGDDRLGNFLVNPGELPPSECVPADTQRPDCTTNPVTAVTVAKASNPASGTTVQPGGQITYTLTFTNTSAAGTVNVDHTDHLSDVLDDANLTGVPTSSSAGLSGAVAGASIRITGQLAPGETATVTYIVTVKPYDQQGNHQLNNVVSRTGEPPVCVAGSGLCTEHVSQQVVPPSPPPATVPPTTPDPGQLPATGGNGTPIAQIAIFLVLAGGVALLITRRRRRSATAIS